MTKSDVYTNRLVNDGDYYVIIPAGQTQSNILDCNGASPVALQTPAAFNAANLTFKTSLSCAVGTFKNVKKTDGSGEAYTIAAVADDHLPINVGIGAGIQFLQIVSSVAQDADRRIDVIMGPVWQ